MTIFFDFEQDFIDSLGCIPMIVRYKLDTCGVKLKLNHWHCLNSSERESLINKPCETVSDIEDYRHYLRQLVKDKTDEYPKDLSFETPFLWEREDYLPPPVKEKAQEFNVYLSLDDWQRLTSLQRFVLIKLSKSGHENRNFFPALKEFNLV